MSRTRPETDRVLDVREVDGEPFGEIVTELGELSADESLLLINSFEPRPLYQVLEQRGFQYETENPESDLWHVHVSHE